LEEKERQDETLPGPDETPETGEETGAAEGPEAAEDGSADKEADELGRMRKQYDALNDRYLRTLAEYDNFRKRSQREKEAVYPAAVAGTVEKFLPVVDSFERALACECADAEFKKGVEMIYESLCSTLKDLKVEELGAVGEAFDANLHNAVMHVEEEGLGENVISAVLQKGYRIGDRVIRYAMVTVAN
jgi:molecular chaperone GrpE